MSTRITLVALVVVAVFFGALFFFGTRHEWDVPPLPPIDGGQTD